jgi:hypothetical protein
MTYINIYYISNHKLISYEDHELLEGEIWDNQARSIIFKSGYTVKKIFRQCFGPKTSVSYYAVFGDTSFIPPSSYEISLGYDQFIL